ncbi:MAG TPA: xanthine dehydrogenase family protein molybdopterin-binding subunit [Actinomycetes bacterium]|jgi:CO/xanthine dehydrogenase Mo-binding subunit|nr:xanthine dehydrogenase family protein molybdopterin-binding subunit [Actinomycetes bacterium]
MRAEDKRLLSGRGTYVDDVALPDALHAALLRSPFAHGRIASLDTAAAQSMPGVAAVVTASTLGFDRRLPVIRSHPGLRHPVGPQVLARQVVRYVGEPVAMALAESRYLAEDALEAIDVDYEPLGIVADAAAAESGEAGVVHAWIPDNLAGSFIQRAGDPDSVLASAPRRVAFTCSISRGSAQALETRGIAAAPHGDVLSVWVNTQRPRGIRALLADYLGLPFESVHVHVPDTGGSFGSKAYLYPEDVLIPWAALRCGRPVRWTEDRAENFVATYPEHEQRFDVEVGVDHDGRILALRLRLLHDLGAYSPYGFAVCQNTADHVVGPYRIPNVEFDCRAVYTNKTPSAPYRGAGRPQGVFVIERVMDAIARQLGLDPADVRRRNLVCREEMPYDTGLDTPGGRLVYDSGDYPRCLEVALRESDYEGWRAQQRQLRDEGRLVGVGVANYIECSITQPHEAARASLLPDGTFRVAVGVSDQGQGHETVFAQIAADVLGVDPSAVAVVGAAEEVVDTVGTYASRSAIMAGSAVAGAAAALRRRLEEVASGALAYGAVPRSSLAEIAGQQGAALDAEHVFRSDAWHVANGTHVAVVEVDPATGRVRFLRYVIAHDAGRVLSREIVEGQVLGGVAQGVAGALLEELVYDDNGQLLTGNFMDYLLPTSAEVPVVEIHHLETPSPHNPLGAKGAGEGGILPTYAVVLSALEDAIGTTLDRVPMTPARITDAIRRAASSLATTLEPAGSP